MLSLRKQTHAVSLPNDKQLLRRLKRGDKESFNELFEIRYARYLTFAKRLLHDATAAEDVVQNVFMRLWIGRAQIDEDRSVDNYLLVSVRHEIFNYRRLRSNARRRDIDPPDLEDRQTDVVQSYTLKETELRIRQGIARVPPPRQAIFEMSRYGNLTNAEIARQRNLSQRTVEKHIEQALKQLRTTINISIAALIMQLF